ncbi:MAG: amidohydrolase family protein [Propionibacteriaceae bacterium]|jgi:imidazolonepropionase-like amidohydrolase|nr:amidohydrolase family protein [Propionibacteriaceae bacterium]
MENLTYIKAGKLYNGLDEGLHEGWKVLVKGNVIAEVGPEVAQPDSARVVDLSHLTVTPGMIDGHIHLDNWDWRTIRDEVYFTSEEMKVLGIANAAKKTLQRGFTTVRHMGGITSKGLGVLDVKECINSGRLEGSRIIAAPLFLCSPGSHGDLSQSLSRNPELSRHAEHGVPTIGSGADFFVNAVREMVKYGADFFKIMSTGGFFTPNDTPEQRQLNDAELKAIIETAHEYGKTVTSHTYTPALMQTLVNFGIDGIEHGALMDEETAALIEDKGVYIVPTFSPYVEAIRYDPVAMANKQPEFRAKLEKYRDWLAKSHEIILASKIKLGFGSDFVAVHQNYDSGWEYQAWLRSKQNPFRALAAATRVNAEILGLSDKLGTLEPGKLADIAGWKRDLMTDELALLDCGYVMKDGVEYEPETCAEL